MARAAAIAAAAALAALVATLVAGGAVTEKVIPGLGDAGATTRWGLPAARLVMDVGAVLTVGALLAAAALLPLPQGRLGPAATGYLRAASWTAVLWAAAAGTTLVLTVSDVLGEPPGKVLAGNELSSYIGSLPQGTGLLLVILLTVVVALLARTTVTPNGAGGLLLVAGIALLPPPLTGHSASAANHGAAVTALALHVVAVVLWVGGLVMLGLHARRDADGLGVMADRFSRMALGCYVLVGFSGLANVAARLPEPAELFTSAYGRLVLAKAVAFAVLGWFGWWHRRRTLPAVADRKPRAFIRLATVEVAVMGAVMGLAVGLARTAPPVVALEEDPVRSLLGYGMPPPLTVGRLLGLWRLDFFFALVVVVLAGLYVAGLVRLYRRGDRWPVGRTVAWFLGLITLVAVTQTGVATYAPILFSVHMAQHMVLSMITPIFLVLGAPLTLALRALKPAKVRGDRGPREWLTAILHSRVIAVVAHPGVATAIFVTSTFALYFTPLFESAMRDHLGHIAMEVHFLASGALFFWVLIGVDPAPRRLPHVGRLLLLFVTMPFHAFFGIALMNLSQPIAAGWYNVVRPPWGTSVLEDQHAGGAIAWGFGEIPTLIVLIVIGAQWFLDDQRQARRQDRKADRAGAGQEDDELARYNAQLAALADRDARER
ncbi:copper resistance protein CopD [Actinomadura craniellae]|uniref:Copper resistance protein CopD n=1 Tax=Actinomadura craniellae TaxID=2231787 RepID=A0A365H2P7_9ACTN|nr:copper resistance protein CopD [Actinomadura craniellae]